MTFSIKPSVHATCKQDIEALFLWKYGQSRKRRSYRNYIFKNSRKKKKNLSLYIYINRDVGLDLWVVKNIVFTYVRPVLTEGDHKPFTAITKMPWRVKD